MRPRRIVARRRSLATFALLVLLALPSAARAQGVAGLLAQVREGSAPGDVLDPSTEERALETAARSFGYAATRRVDALVEAHPDLSQARVRKLRERAAAATERFAARARDELIDAKGDGLLTEKELAEEIAEARRSELDALEDFLEAARVGAGPPPRREDAPGLAAHLQAMARYALLERNPPRRWIALAVSIAGTGLLVALALRGLGAVARRRRGTLAELASRTVNSLRGPLVVTALAGAAGLALGSIWLPSGAGQAASLLLELVAIAALLWLFWSLSGDLARSLARLVTRRSGRAADEVADLARKGLRLVALLAFGLWLAERLLGMELGTMLAGVGLVGVAVSVAAQDTLRNVFGSLTLHGDRPFLVGDFVRVGQTLGHVEEIGFRSTRIRTLEGPRMSVPNAELVRDPVVNLSARGWIRHRYDLDLVYDTPAERVEEAVEQVDAVLRAQDHPDAVPPYVVFHRFGEHGLRLQLAYASKTGDWVEAQRHRTRVNLEILERFRQAGLHFAFPTRTLHLASVPGEARAAEGDEDP